MTRETIYLVQSFADGRGGLKADPAIRCKSEDGARRRAQLLGETKAGAVAFSSSGDADLGDSTTRFPFFACSAASRKISSGDGVAAFVSTRINMRPDFNRQRRLDIVGQRQRLARIAIARVGDVSEGKLIVHGLLADALADENLDSSVPGLDAA
ncbi:MAG: hypothetical protein WDN76_00465 [Alphaproteobacteria bacterium]